MGIAHLLDVGNQKVGDVPVGEEAPLPGAAPGAQMDLVNIHGPVVGRVFLAVGKPLVVPPAVAGQVAEDRSGVGAQLGTEGIGIGLADVMVVGGPDGVLIGITRNKAGEEPLPDAPLYPRQRVRPGIPPVKWAEDGHLLCVGRPDPEKEAGLPLLLMGVGPEMLPGSGGTAFRKSLQAKIAVVRCNFFL